MRLLVQPFDALFAFATPYAKYACSKKVTMIPNEYSCFFQFATPPQREGQFTYPKSNIVMKNDALVLTFVREAFSRDREINENLDITLGVSSLKNMRS